MGQWAMEGLVKFAGGEDRQDISPLDTIMGAMGDERAGVFDQLATGKARLLRALPDKPVRREFPETSSYEALATRPTLCTVGSSLVPFQAAVNIFSILDFEAEAIGPPYQP